MNSFTDILSRQVTVTKSAKDQNTFNFVDYYLNNIAILKKIELCSKYCSENIRPIDITSYDKHEEFVRAIQLIRKTIDSSFKNLVSKRFVCENIGIHRKDDYDETGIPIGYVGIHPKGLISIRISHYATQARYLFGLYVDEEKLIYKMFHHKKDEFLEWAESIPNRSKIFYKVYKKFCDTLVPFFEMYPEPFVRSDGSHIEIDLLSGTRKINTMYAFNEKWEKAVIVVHRVYVSNYSSGNDSEIIYSVDGLDQKIKAKFNVRSFTDDIEINPVLSVLSNEILASLRQEIKMFKIRNKEKTIEVANTKNSMDLILTHIREEMRAITTAVGV